MQCLVFLLQNMSSGTVKHKDQQTFAFCCMYEKGWRFVIALHYIPDSHMFLQNISPCCCWSFDDSVIGGTEPFTLSRADVQFV